MIIAIDFDGTCVTHDYPRIGSEIGAIPVLKKLVEKGHQLILWTIRSGDELQAACDWFNDNGIPLFGVNINPDQKTWSQSPKVYAQLYIDDAALGCPFLRTDLSTRPYADWAAIESWLIVQQVL